MRQSKKKTYTPTHTVSRQYAGIPKGAVVSTHLSQRLRSSMFENFTTIDAQVDAFLAYQTRVVETILERHAHDAIRRSFIVPEHGGVVNEWVVAARQTHRAQPMPETTASPDELDRLFALGFVDRFRGAEDARGQTSAGVRRMLIDAAQPELRKAPWTRFVDTTQIDWGREIWHQPDKAFTSMSRRGRRSVRILHRKGTPLMLVPPIRFPPSPPGMFVSGHRDAEGRIPLSIHAFTSILPRSLEAQILQVAGSA